ncbi:MAG: type VI secretion system protein ImpG [Desulfobulbaceae bacterium A2]|nr:MAG: type VI secretion system protein ImpG [Desulfobulbaceae bacterium A2]
MLNRYYLQELAALRDLGKEFAEANPAIASMLSGPTADPDVERLLEGVAFLTALIREKLDDDFPEIVHDLVRLIWPHYLRPMPATSIVAFTPKASLKQPLTIPAGVQLASIPITNTTCLFRTSTEVQVHPLTLLKAAFIQPPGKSAAISLHFELKGMPLKNWQVDTLRIHLAGDYPEACDRYYVLNRYLRRLVLRAQEDERSCVLSREHLRPAGLAAGSGALPYPGNAFPAYRLLQEYFAFPRNFLFVDITGLDKWGQRGEGQRFELLLELDDLPFPPPRIRTEDFLLFATPVINLFAHEADPIRLDHKRTEYRLTPAGGGNTDQLQIYSVDRVTGYIQGTATPREYRHFDQFNRDILTGPVYNISQKQSPSRRRTDIYLSVAYPPQSGPPLPETLSIGLTCTNGALPERIQVGDICQPTSSTPELVEFKNIIVPSAEILPPLGANVLWRLLAHLSLNHVSLTNIRNFQSLLGLYLFPDTQDRSLLMANQKRIAGLEGLSSQGADRLVSGIMLRGREITCKARADNFASRGDLYLFGSVLNEFFAVYASLNSFTRFVLYETISGESISWPARIGQQPLI